MTAAKRSRLSVRGPAAGKRGVKTGRGRGREESRAGGRRASDTGDTGRSEEGAGVERIQYRWVILIT